MYNVWGSMTTPFQTHVSSKMEWTLVQKKTTQKSQTDYISRMSAVETSATQKDNFKQQKEETSASGASESWSTVVDTSAHGTSVEQTNINSLIGVPFIIRSYQDIEPKADESPDGTRPRRLKGDDIGRPGNVRGLLRIDPSKLNHETVTASNGQEVGDMSEMNEVDWPSISGYHSTREDHGDNVPSAEDSKSWSTVLRTVSLPQPTKRVSISIEEYEILVSLPCPFLIKGFSSPCHCMCTCENLRAILAYIASSNDLAGRWMYYTCEIQCVIKTEPHWSSESIEIIYHHVHVSA